MRLHRLLPLGLLLALLLPGSADAGTYPVTTCFGAETGAWSESEPSPAVAVYSACPGGAIDPEHPQAGEGLVVRNSMGESHARTGAAGALVFAAPAGSRITGLDFTAQLLSNPGWEAGIFDATGGRWLWCGAHCLGSAGAWVHRELRDLDTGRIEARVRCAASRCRRDGRHALIALRDVRVLLEDPSPPRIGGLRGALATAGGWLRGSADIAFDAADNSGIRSARVELDGRVVHAESRPCDFTRPVPCTDGATSATFDTRVWPDGEHAVRVAAEDAAGNRTEAGRTVRTDNTAPAEPGVTVDGGPEWSPAAARTLRLALPGGQASPLVRARVRACGPDGTCSESAPALEGVDPAAGTASAPVRLAGAPGEYAVRLALEDAAGNVGAWAAPVVLRFDPVPPGVPDVSAADAWLSGGRLALATAGTTPVSGVRGYAVRIGGRVVVVPAALPLDDLSEGRTPIEARAVSGAGVDSTAVSTTVKLDRTRPTVSASGAPPEGAWSPDPVRIELRGSDQPGLSGVATVAWRLRVSGAGGDAPGGTAGEDAVADPAGAADAAEAADPAGAADIAEAAAAAAGGDGDTTVPGDRASVDVSGDGEHTLAYRAVDAAGNASERHKLTVRVDRTPPETLAFEATDPADPQRISVVVADATSGVARGRLELRRDAQEWRPLPSTLRDGRLVARIDDATFPRGRYALRAHAVDAAGNEAVGTARVDGTPAVMTLPLRARPRLRLRRAGSVLHARLMLRGAPLAGEVTLAQRLRGAVAWVPVCGQTIVLTRRPRAGVTTAASRTAGPAGAVAATGPAATTGATRAAEVTRTAPRGRPADSCSIATDATGRLSIRLAPGPSRVLRLRFAGTPTVLPARARVRVRTRARLLLRATPARVVAGRRVRLSGRLLGGHVPPGGKLVELQARISGGWRTFTTSRAGADGRFHATHRFATSSTGGTYVIRARIRRESAYPFEPGWSAPVTVRVE